MANLSNINGKFVVEQTTGYVGVGTTDPNYPIEVLNASAEIALNASGGSIYRVQSDSASNFIIRKAGVGDRLVINSAGNVGIGVNPSQKLEVNGAAKWFGATSTDFAQTGGQIDYYDTGRQFRFNAYKADSTGAEIVFNTGGTTSFDQRMVINALGNVGINVLNPGFQSVDGYGQIGIEIKGGKENNQAPCVRLHETGSGKGSFELRSTRNVLTSGNYFAIAEGTDTFFAIRADDDTGGTSTRGYVGIGTTSPLSKLDLRGTAYVTGYTVGFDTSPQGNYAYRLTNDGANSFINILGGGLGIGTTGPNEKLHVVGNVFLNAGSAYIASYNNTYNYQASMRWAGLQLGNNGTNRIIAGRTAAGGGFQFWTNNTNDASDHTVTPDGVMTMAMTETGNVGIGNTSPSSFNSLGGKQVVIGDGTQTNNLTLYSATTGGGVGYGHIAFADSNTSGSTAQYAGLIQYYHGNDSMQFYTDSTPKMTILSGGNVGIGVTVPAARLNVVGVGQANNPTVAIDVTNSDQFNHGLEIFDGNLTTGETVLMAIGHSGSTKNTAIYGYIHNSSGSDNNLATIGFWGQDNKLTVAAGGNVGIGTGTGAPAYKLDVAGTIRATGDVIAYSDVRVKENIKTIDNSLEKVSKLRGVEFNKIGDNEKSIGVIAQEIEKVIPEVVKEDDKGMKSVAYGNISGLLIEAIKELKAEIEELKFNKCNCNK